MLVATLALLGCREPTPAQSQETLRCESLESDGHTVGCGFIVGEAFVQAEEKASWSVLEGVDAPEEITPLSLAPLEPYEFVLELTREQRQHGVIIRAIRPDGREFSAKIID